MRKVLVYDGEEYELFPIDDTATVALTPAHMGAKGGKSRSKRKLAAAQENIAKAHKALAKKRKGGK